MTTLTSWCYVGLENPVFGLQKGQNIDHLHIMYLIVLFWAVTPPPHTCVTQGLKIEGLFALLTSNLGGSVGQPLFFPKSGHRWHAISIIFVCAFVGMQTLKTGLILVLEGIVFHYIWLKILYWVTNYIFWHIILTFFFKIQNWVSKKKKERKKKKKKKKSRPLFSNNLGRSVGKGQTNIYFF